MRPRSQHKQWSYNSQGELLFFGKALKSYCKAGSAYVYHRQALQERLSMMSKGLSGLHEGELQLHYACKANSHPEILRIIRQSGWGADVVSAGEMKRALKVGFHASQIVFSGVGKTETEILFAIQKGIGQINVESLPELSRVGRLSELAKKQVCIGLRVNPAVNPKTHPYIATGFRENKFGLDMTQLPAALRILREFPRLQFMGLSLHIGSQLFDFKALREAIDLVRVSVRELSLRNFPSLILDIGGGIGVDYKKSAEEIDAKTLEKYCRQIRPALKDGVWRLAMEPGRFAVARCGVLLTRIEYLKRTPEKKFVIVGSGMNHLLRPALYQAEHRILPLRQRKTDAKSEIWDVVGPVCESSDVLGRGRKFAGLQEGDWLAISDTGAYGASMSSDYNSFPRAQEIII